MNRSLFFDAVRTPLFGGQPNAKQTEGMSAILDACVKYARPVSHASYVLATAFHETGKSMFPNRESLNYSVAGLLSQFGRNRISLADAQRLGRAPGQPALSVERQRAIANLVYGGDWGRVHLGNTQPNDGWHFRGGGMDHCTGRRNFRAVADATGLGDALMVDPDGILALSVAAEAAVTGMRDGRYTGRRLDHYLPRTGVAELAAFARCRAIINGTDRADDVAAYAVKFQRALVATGYTG